ncbi:oligosaccharide flippase family protein [Clostridium sp. D2Q-11]|uniref:Oligosaccharide flippase family protein n=1 Tax=Anaeromonas frigoriresistens TaxID=2683708 RepID=A0A942Z808_9FIRM|nr:oligosaccharide flippase family protein [Anaeromonas frigoriresistens]MBS4539287.1 oligosaccharide flippase family protein [Anaeromonas frigoriresistens]
MKDNLLKKFLSFSYGSWIGLVIGFVGTMITTRILSPQDFGKASMFTLVLNISMIFIIFGTDQSFVRFFYEEVEDKRGSLLYNCIKIPLLLTVVVSLVILLFSERVSVFLFEEYNFNVLVVLIIGIIIQVLYRYGTLVIRMQQKGNLFSILEILNRLLSLIIILILYHFLGAKYEIIIYSTVINLFLLTIISIISQSEYWNIRNLRSSQTTHNIKDILHYGSPLVLTMLITWLFQSFDKIAIKQWSSFDELGLYAAAFKIVALLNILKVTFSTFWTPVCYERFENNPDDKHFYEKITRMISFFLFLVAIFSIAGKDIIIYLLGREYKAAANIMPFLVFMPVMYTISETTVIGINFYKKPKWHILIALTSCLINIMGNWLLVPKYGAIGASISTAFSYIVFFTLRTQISLVYYNVNFGLKKIYFMIFIISVYAMYSVVNSNFYLNLLLGGVVILLMSYLYRKDLVNSYKIFNINKLFSNKS